ncbi:hypothetical protein EV646_102455 [Kribbella antiqua]|uniref:Substrate-binding family protein n=1 Tax=Kribbella antiqua TaxID=2512217 RepID=A0A4R2IX59_9ACTN|nr:hypothetical protein [Kribbella antiqua]TCO50381.1 hypothetical protein EV646_102455 [Kribbella antiqua]
MPERSEAAVVSRVGEETKSLEELYADALAEGGELVFYAGGDTATQKDFTKQAFLTRFPKMKLTTVVDYSKFHDVRVDNQLATGTLVPHVVQLQTLQDFTRWKKQGKLLPYKPAGFSQLYTSTASRGSWPTAPRSNAGSRPSRSTSARSKVPRAPAGSAFIQAPRRSGRCPV